MQSVGYQLALPPVWCLRVILFTFMSITASEGEHCVGFSTRTDFPVLPLPPVAGTK